MKKALEISYDKEADVMYLGLGRPTKAVTEEIDQDILARYHPKTKALVGVTVVNFSQRFGKKPGQIQVPEYKPA